MIVRELMTVLLEGAAVVMRQWHRTGSDASPSSSVASTPGSRRDSQAMDARRAVLNPGDAKRTRSCPGQQRKSEARHGRRWSTVCVWLVVECVSRTVAWGIPAPDLVATVPVKPPVAGDCPGDPGTLAVPPGSDSPIRIGIRIVACGERGSVTAACCPQS